MAGEASTNDDDPCPLCGGPGLPASTRVTLAKRRLFPVDAVTATTTTTLRADDVWSSSSAAALRESLRAVTADLDAERAAAADAATEAMSMILRLQRERSEALMEARQYRRYAEDRFAHDAAQAAALRDAVRAMSARLAECRARLLRLGYPLPSSSPYSSPYSSDDDCCPSVPCLLDHHHPTTTTSPAADVGTPRTHHLLNRMHRDEPSSSDALTFSYSYSDAAPGADDDEYYHLHATPLRDAPDQDHDDDRVYTVDAVHPGIPTPSSLSSSSEAAEIQKLKARLQALEADRESMRRAVESVADEKAQVVLLREVAQHLCKQGATAVPVKMKVQQQQPRLQHVAAAPRKLVNRRQPSFVKVFIVTVIKWIASIFRWRRKSDRIKHPIGLCGSNVGLMLVLDRYPKQRCRRFIKRI